MIALVEKLLPLKLILLQKVIQWNQKLPVFFVEFKNVLHININGKYIQFNNDLVRITKTSDRYVVGIDDGGEIFSAILLGKDLDIMSQDEDCINVRFEIGEPRYLDQRNLNFSYQVKIIDAESGEDIDVLDDMHNTFSILNSNDIFLITC